MSKKNRKHGPARRKLRPESLEDRILLSATWADADTDAPQDGATDGDDIATGSAGNDVLDAMDGDDQLFGNDGDDLLTGGAGNDLIDGGADNDTAVFTGNSSDYTVTKVETDSGTEYRVNDTRADSSDGEDTLRNIETLQFADGDFDPDDLLASSETSEVNLSDGLVLHLTFDGESMVAEDQSAAENNVREQGDIESVESGDEQVGEFDGDDTLFVDKDSSINSTVTERTVTLNFKIADAEGRQVLFEEGGTARGLNVYLDDGELIVGGYNRPSGESDWEGTYLLLGNVDDGEWHQVTVTLDGGPSVEANALKAYLNGELAAQGEGSQLWPHGNPNAIGGVNSETLFHDGAGRGDGYGFKGEIDEVRVYDRAINDAEIQTLADRVSDADQTFTVTNPQDGDTFSFNGHEGSDTLDLSAFESDDLTFRDGEIEVTLDDGGTFTVTHENIEQLTLADANAVFTDADVSTELTEPIILVDGDVAFRVDPGDGAVDVAYDAETNFAQITAKDGSAVNINSLGATDVTIASIDVQGDVAGITSDVDVGTITIGATNDVGTVTIGGGDGQISEIVFEAGQNVDADPLTINADVGTITAHEFASDITLNGDVTSISLRDDLQGATLTINGDAAAINIGDGMGGGADLEVSGNVGSLTLGGVMQGGTSISLGSADTLEIGHVKGGSISVAQDLGSFSTTASGDNSDFNGTLTVGSSVNTIDIGDDLAGTITIGGDLGTITMGDDIKDGGSISVAGDANTITAPGGIFPGTSITVGSTEGSFTLTDGDTVISRSYDTPVPIQYDGDTLTETNVAPDAISVNSNAVAEDAPIGTLVGKANASDSNTNETLTYSLTDDADGSFAIDPDTGEITTAKALDHETNDQLQVTVRATDAAGETIDQQITIDVTDVNEAITSLSITPPVIETTPVGFEDAPVGSNPTQLNFGSGVSAQVSQTNTTESKIVEHTDNHGAIATEGDRFWKIRGGETTLTFSEPVNEVTFNYSDYDGWEDITVTAGGKTLSIDQISSNTSESFTITAEPGESFEDLTIDWAQGRDGIGIDSMSVTPAPAAISIPEDATPGTIVASAAATDPDENETFAYSLTDDADGRFEIDANTGQITVADSAEFDHETADALEVTVQVEDSAGNTLDQVLSIGITDVNEAPTSITLDADNPDTNLLRVTIGGERGGGGGSTGAPAYQVVVDGEVVASGKADWMDMTRFGDQDPDSRWQELEITLPGDTSPDQVEVRFTNDAWGGTSETDRNLYVDKIEVNGATFEAEADDTVYDRSSGADRAGQEGMWWSGALEFDTSAAPDPLHATVSENSPGATVGSIASVDPDAGDTLTVTVSDDRFEVVNGDLKLKPDAQLDHESEPVIAITVTATDAAGESIDETFRIGISNANDAPEIAQPTTINATEGSQVSLSITATDQDGDNLTYTWQQTSGPEVTLDDPNAASPSFQAPDVGSDTEITFQVTVSDGTTETIETVDVAVEANATPVIDAGSTISVAEGETVTLTPSVSAGGPTIDFETAQIDSHGGTSQDKDLTVTTDGDAIKLEGNGWKSIPLPTTITADTVLELEIRATGNGEIQGIGFDTDGSLSENRSFQLAGSQSWGIDVADSGEPTGDGWVKYRIPVGEHFTGDMDRLVLINDHDTSNPTSTTEFRSVRVTDAETVNNAELDSDLSFEWRQTGGPTVELSDATAKTPTFEAPDVGTDSQITFEVTVTDGDNTSTDSVTVNVEANAAPIIDAGNDLTVTEGEPVTLSSSVSAGETPPMDFDQLDLNTHGGSNQDIDLTVTTDANTLTLEGNGWKSVDIPTTVTSDTVLEFQFRTNGEGEIQGIGFDDDGSLSENRSFKLSGTQQWGTAIEPVSEPDADGWATYRIPVGDHFTGDFDRVVFFNDHDVASSGSTGEFRDVRIQDNAAPTQIDTDLTYQWEQIAGPSVTLTDPTAANPGFDAPSIDSTAELVFRVSVSDGDNVSTDEVRVQVDPLPEPEPLPEPDPVIDEVVEPDPVIDEVIEPDPVIDEVIEPDPVIDEVVEPDPVIDEVIEPDPVIDEVVEPDPVIDEVIEPDPVIDEVIEPDPVIDEVVEPDPVIDEVVEPDPVIDEVVEPDPVIDEVVEPDPVIEKVVEPTSEPLSDQPREPTPVQEQAPAADPTRYVDADDWQQEEELAILDAQDEVDGLVELTSEVIDADSEIPTSSEPTITPISSVDIPFDTPERTGFTLNGQPEPPAPLETLVLGNANGIGAAIAVPNQTAEETRSATTFDRQAAEARPQTETGATLEHDTGFFAKVWTLVRGLAVRTPGDRKDD